MELLSALVGAIVGAVLVIFWQYLNDKVRSRNDLTIETTSYLDAIDTLIFKLRTYKDERFSNRPISISDDEDRANRNEFFRLIYAEAHRMKLKLEFNANGVDKAFVDAIGLYMSAVRMIPQFPDKIGWDGGFLDYMTRMVGPARERLTALLVERCSTKAILREMLFTTPVFWP